MSKVDNVHRMVPTPETQARWAAARAKRRQRFVKFPLEWADRLAKINCGPAWPVALYLLYHHWRAGGRPIPLSTVGLKEWGVASRSKRRALTKLEAAGLIRVERRVRKSPLVDVLE